MTSRRAVLAGLGAGGALLLSKGGAQAQSRAYTSIVSVGGAVTETLFALGLGNKLRAVDTTSTYPASALQLPKVGYLRQLSAEGILALKPDLVLLSGEAGPAAAVEHMKTAGVALRQIDIGRSPLGVVSMIEAIGSATGEVEAAGALAATVTDQFNLLDAALPSVERKSILLLLAAGNGPLLGAGTNTAASAMVDLACGELAFPDMQGYKAVSLEPVLAADPDWIVIPSHVAAALGGAKGVAALEVVARSRAGAEGRVAIIDSHYLLGFGPRAPQAAADLATLLYPNAAIPVLNRDATPSSLVTIAVAV